MHKDKKKLEVEVRRDAIPVNPKEFEQKLLQDIREFISRLPKKRRPQ